MLLHQTIVLYEKIFQSKVTDILEMNNKIESIIQNVEIKWNELKFCNKFEFNNELVEFFNNNITKKSKDLKIQNKMNSLSISGSKVKLVYRMIKNIPNLKKMSIINENVSSEYLNKFDKKFLQAICCLNDIKSCTSKEDCIKLNLFFKILIKINFNRSLVGLNKVEDIINDDNLLLIQMYISFKFSLITYAMNYSITKNKWFLKNYCIKKSHPLFKITGKSKYFEISLDYLKLLNNLKEEELELFQQYWLYKSKNNNFIANDELIEIINKIISSKVKKPTFKYIFKIKKNLNFLNFLDNQFENFFNVNVKKKNVSFSYDIKKKEILCFHKFKKN